MGSLKWIFLILLAGVTKCSINAPPDTVINRISSPGINFGLLLMPPPFCVPQQLIRVGVPIREQSKQSKQLKTEIVMQPKQIYDFPGYHQNIWWCPNSPYTQNLQFQAKLPLVKLPKDVQPAVPPMPLQYPQISSYPPMFVQNPALPQDFVPLQNLPPPSNLVLPQTSVPFQNPALFQNSLSLQNPVIFQKPGVVVPKNLAPPQYIGLQYAQVPTGGEGTITSEVNEDVVKSDSDLKESNQH